MPLPGGQSTITGVNFEAWFLTYKITDALFDENVIIRPQAKCITNPNTNKTELVSIDDIFIQKDKNEEYYNIKYRSPNLQIWKVNDLKNNGVLKQFKDQFLKGKNTKLLFVSQSPCPIFHEILPRVSSCTNKNEIEIMLKTKDRKYSNSFAQIQQELGFSYKRMIKFAKCVEYKPVISAEDLKSTIYKMLKNHLTNSEFAPNVLYQLAIESSMRSKYIYQLEVIDYLEKNNIKNIQLKSHLQPENLLSQITDASAGLLSIHSAFFGDEHLEREETNKLFNLVNKPLEEKDSPLVILTGKAGSGKSVIVRDLYLKLKNENIPVLGIKTDRYMFNSIEKLQKELQLKDSIKKIMATIVENKGRAVVIFDQIDALSQSHSIDRNIINTYINLISILKNINRLRIIISCRDFDLNYDEKLNSLINRKKDNRISVSELTEKEINSVLTNLNISLDRITIPKKLYDILKVTNYLTIFCKIYNPKLNLNLINTSQDLFNELWEQKISKIDNENLRNLVLDFIYEIVKIMNEKKILAVSKSLFIDRYNKAITYLLTNSILFENKNKLEFFHSSFFDYCFSRRFVENNQSLIKWVTYQHQGLFIRSQINQVMAYLRGNDLDRYLKELNAFLMNRRIKFHLKLLIINQLGYWQNPFNEEWEIVKNMLDKAKKFRLHFIEAIQSEKWLIIMIDENYFTKYLTSGDETVINKIIWKFWGLINAYSDIIINYLVDFPDIKDKEKHLFLILERLEHWENKKAIQLFKKNLLFFKKQNSLYFHFLLEHISKYEPILILDVIFNIIDERVENIKSEKDFDKKELIDRHEIGIIEKLINETSNIQKIISHSLIIIKKLVEKTNWDWDKLLYYDRAFFSYGEFSSSSYPPWQLLDLILTPLKDIAKKNKVRFKNLIRDIEITNSKTLVMILLISYNENPKLYLDEIYSLLFRNEILESSYSFGLLGYNIRLSLRKNYTYFTERQKDNMKNIITNLYPSWEKKRRKGGYSSFGHIKHTLLNSLPKKEVMEDSNLKKQYLELNRKFGEFKIDEKEPPKPQKAGFVGPPLQKTAYDKMSIDQWIESFKKYDDETGWGKPKEHFSKGGIIEHSRMFGNIIKNNPDRFYDLVFDLGKRDDISKQYLSEGFRGLVEGKYDIDKIKSFVNEYWKIDDTYFKQQIIKAIQYISQVEELDFDFINILSKYASGKPELIEESWKEGNLGGDPLISGINNVRGSAVWQLTVQGYKTKYPEKIFSILEKISNVHSVAVRCCVISNLSGMIQWNRERTFNLFMNLTNDDNPYIIQDGLHCLYYLMNEDNFTQFIPKIEKVIDVEETFHSKVGKNLGQILMSAYCRDYFGARKLLNLGFRDNEKIILGAIDFATKCLYYENKEVEKKCQKIFKKFLNSKSKEISREYDWGFQEFECKHFNSIYRILQKYSKSKVVQNDSTLFIKYLSKCVNHEPLRVFQLIKNFNQFEKPDIRYNALSNDLVKILVEAYNKTRIRKYKNKIINVFDKVLQNESYKKYALDVLADVDRS